MKKSFYLFIIFVSVFALSFISQAHAATPGFVSETGKNSTLTYALGVNPNGQDECANYSYCLPYTEAALSGNLGIIPFAYANVTSVSATTTDDKGDSYTCLTGSED